VLCVDDQVFNVDALEILLRACHVDTNNHMHFAYGGQQSVLQVEAQSDLNAYHLILMDCNMPFMDGYQATKRIREIYAERQVRQPYIAAITGHGEEEFI